MLIQGGWHYEKSLNLTVHRVIEIHNKILTLVCATCVCVSALKHCDVVGNPRERKDGQNLSLVTHRGAVKGSGGGWG